MPHRVAISSEPSIGQNRKINVSDGVVGVAHGRERIFRQPYLGDCHSLRGLPKTESRQKVDY